MNEVQVARCITIHNRCQLRWLFVTQFPEK